jgi:hypothetical protein
MARRLANKPRHSPPADALEETGDLRRGAIRIFAMREVTDIGKKREIEIRERLAEFVGPLGKQDRVGASPSARMSSPKFSVAAAPRLS